MSIFVPVVTGGGISVGGYVWGYLCGGLCVWVFVWGVMCVSICVGVRVRTKVYVWEYVRVMCV